MREYHDVEWGVPLHDDRALFELLTLEGAQAGLSWSTILNRRAGYRRAFAAFDLEAVAAFAAEDEARLLADAGIIRNRAKISATIGNARAPSPSSTSSAASMRTCGLSSGVGRSRTAGRAATFRTRPMSRARCHATSSAADSGLSVRPSATRSCRARGS